MASGEMIVKGGFIIDPTRKIDGDVGDVAIKDGKIVDKVGSSAKVIDAKGKVVMAGAVDVHSHVAGPKVNAGRLMRPEDKFISGVYRSGRAQKNGYRMESGFSIPSVFKTGYAPSSMIGVSRISSCVWRENRGGIAASIAVVYPIFAYS